MDARKGNIYEILNGNKQFLIPVYQRFYSWDIDQCKRLWNDIVDMQKKERFIIVDIETPRSFSPADGIREVAAVVVEVEPVESVSWTIPVCDVFPSLISVETRPVTCP